MKADFFGGVSASGAGKLIDTFAAFHLRNHDAQSVTLIDGQHIAQKDNVQAHNTNTVPVVENYVSVRPLEIHVSSVFGFIVQFPVAVF